MSDMNRAEESAELAARVAGNIAAWQARVEPYFGYLRTKHGFRITQTDSLWWETYIVYQSDRVAIKVTRSRESAWVETELIRLVDGTIPDVRVFVTPDEPIDRFHLEALLEQRAPQILDEIKAARGLEPEQVERSLALQAHALAEYATDVLLGDFTIFAAMEVRVKQHVKEHPQTLTIHIPDDAGAESAERETKEMQQRYPGVNVTVERYQRSPSAPIKTNAALATSPTADIRAASTSQHFPADLYEMSVGAYKLFRFNQIMLTLIGAATIVISLYLLAGGLLNTRTPVIYLYPLTLNATIILTAFAVGGLVMLLTSLRAHHTVILADRKGMRKRWLLGNSFIPWDQVQEVVAYTVNSHPRSYRISGLTDQGKRAVIRWPMFPFDPNPKLQEAGAVLTNPRDMAAIIVARSGKPLITR